MTVSGEGPPGHTRMFEDERPRLRRIAARILDDEAEADDVVQQAWIRLHGADAAAIGNLPGWLTTVTTRLCLDVLRARRAAPQADVGEDEWPVDGEGRHRFQDGDPVHAAESADDVGAALRVVLHALTPAERVAFVLHDSFGFDFPAIGRILDCAPATARKRASRARARLGQAAGPGAAAPESAVTPTDWEIVDAFLVAAREGEFARLLALLAPDATVTADADAVATGTPARLDGREAVAAMFDGAAKAALPVFVEGRPGAAWFLRGRPRVAFDFTVARGKVQGIEFRAESSVLGALTRREGGVRRTRSGKGGTDRTAGPSPR
ncbi:sigma-70 family RNA polymerase sigma factor [Tomitella gaofuii]|uniref:sigma-70 family RNA polymerase sigma factor n=1 Tax=Tomitella gaofuii TaxID=2760083 RepID=UPI0015F98F8C|nr:sigma-70 family RNA polymerase sigma factor [Tomitella gaofuii]